MKAIAWPCPAPGGTGEEFALIAGPDDAARRVLIVPALFEEANRTRRMLAQTMRLLADAGIAAMLPDLPGCGDSLAPLERQTLASWRAAIGAAAETFGATEVLAVRGGALVAPALPGFALEPTAGVLRPLLRARGVAAREEGRDEPMTALLERGRGAGIELAGYRLGAEMVRDLDAATLDSRLSVSKLDDLGGTALWLRSEPGDDPALAAALVARIVGQ